MFNNAMSILKVNPRLPNVELRKHLINLIPKAIHMDAAYLRNFKLKAQIHHAQHDNQYSIPYHDAKVMLIRRSITTPELDSLKTPLVIANFNEISRNVMLNDDNVWTALSYLQKCKNELPGFDYQIHYAKDGKPDGLMYMTLEMKWNLLRYGDILFIDAQMRAFNKIGWPYSGLALRNSENKVCLGCEGILSGETTAFYTWMIETLAILEKRWSVTNIRMIFADGTITNTLLVNLKIQDTCVLHGDFFHLYKEVWPKKENFGSTVYSLIKGYLKIMLSSSTEDEWSRAYNEARLRIIRMPLQLELLDKIYSNV